MKIKYTEENSIQIIDGNKRTSVAYPVTHEGYKKLIDEWIAEGNEIEPLSTPDYKAEAIQQVYAIGERLGMKVAGNPTNLQLASWSRKAGAAERFKKNQESAADIALAEGERVKRKKGETKKQLAKIWENKDVVLMGALGVIDGSVTTAVEVINKATEGYEQIVSDFETNLTTDLS